MNRYTLAGVKHGGTLIKGLQNSDFNPNMVQIVSSGSGHVEPTMVSIDTLQPEFTYTASDIKGVLGVLGADLIAAMSSDKLWLQKMAADGLRAGAGAHVQVTMANGMIVGTQITAAKGQGEAKISVRCIPRSSDGDASPLAMIANATLEAAQGQVTDVYTLGPVSINGVALDGVDNFTLDANFNIDILNTKVYPTAVGVLDWAPIITITTFDLAKFQSWAEAGIAQSSSDSTIQLLDQAAGGARGSSPITFTIDAGMIHFTSWTAPQGARASGSVVVTPVSDGVADIIALSGI